MVIMAVCICATEQIFLDEKPSMVIFLGLDDAEIDILMSAVLDFSSTSVSLLVLITS